MTRHGPAFRRYPLSAGDISPVDGIGWLDEGQTAKQVGMTCVRTSVPGRDSSGGRDWR